MFIEILKKEDFQSNSVKALIQSAIDFAIEDMDRKTSSEGMIISKIKK